MEPDLERGRLFVISAPSGTGKSSLVRRLLDKVPGLEFSVSYTTRPPRQGEVDGREYHFVDETRFDAMIGAEGFLEWARVFDRRYGTGRDATDKALGQGRDVVLDIDVQGARHVRESGVPAVSVFILPPDYATLKSRLELRGSEDATQVHRRLAAARLEADEYTYYDYVVVNDDLDRAERELSAIVRAERVRRARREKTVRRILATFPARGSGPTEI